ncbi:MAG TPA: glutathione-disulfide reductase [Thiotrichaceae bacterium]|jgi:glutathione reductase (NADPH)|nr:glutathione-disulfide reductase [Thiotrichaceae bacterium]HIM08289.1 glutathione-disulfide reductase [Gammaproteobacteria bacterium]
MSEYRYDLFVIGAGSGGVRAARMSSGLGAHVAIAEDRYLGGTCVNVGCVPKKLFVYASHLSEEIENARGFGWSIGNSNFDWSTLIKNKNTEIKRLNGVYKKLLDNTGVETIHGRATIVDEHTVEVEGQQITAERILVATGGWPSIPEIHGKEHIISSNEAFFLESLPEKIIIVGGGYIAVEFAGIFHGLGVDTTLLYRGPLFLRGFDEDIRRALADEMQKKGIKIKFNSNISEIEKNNDEQLIATLEDGERLDAGQIMYATGRTPVTNNLGLEKVSIVLDKDNAIKVNDQYQTNVPSIYAIGDVTNRVNLTPVALAEGMVLAKRLFGNEDKDVDYENIPTCVFSQPNIGTVGLTEEEAREKYDDIELYKSSFRPMKLSLSDSDEKTFMKLIVDKASDLVVGVHMLGPDAGEIIQGIGIALKAGATKKVFDSTIGIHPTAAEEFVTMRDPVKE